MYRSSAVSYPFHDNCPIPIYAAKCLYVVVVLCFSMFSCGSCWVWYDNRIIGDFRIFLCAICLICQLKNPSHHCSAQNPNIEWMDFSRNLLLRKKIQIYSRINILQSIFGIFTLMITWGSNNYFVKFLVILVWLFSDCCLIVVWVWYQCSKTI